MAWGPRDLARAATVLESHDVLREPWVALRRDTVQSPDGRRRTVRTVFEYPDWVDVIALTADLNIVLVEQYRHSVGQVRTEFPAGAVESGEPPLAAIKRELLEETGYAGEDWRPLGTAPVNPVWQANRIHSFLALGVHRIADQNLDQGEVIRTCELPWPEFIARVERGAIELPALQLGGLYLLSLHLHRSSDPRMTPLRF